MIAESILQEISGIIGQRNLLTHGDDLSEYAGDATDVKSMPDAVAFPADAEEISQILRLANRSHFPVVPRGAGSGKSGGAVPIKGGLVLGMDRMNRIIEIDTDNLIAKVEPGVITAHLQEEVEKVDLFYPPDPASIKISTIGGNVAECAGGLRAVKYGVTRDYVLGLKVVLPTGDIMKTGVGTSKGVVGYDLTRLIVGSEGTLAVITEIILRLIPKPETKKTMLVFFPDAEEAVKTVTDIIRNKIVPTTLEFMDKHSINSVREKMGAGIPSEAGALLLVEVDGTEANSKEEAERVRDICINSRVLDFQLADDEDEAERLWEARREVSEAIMTLRSGKINEDIVVPRSLMAKLISFLSRLEEKYQLPIPAFGHAGDGNIHVNIMYDKEDPREKEKAESAVKELFKMVIEMGGTISGEHGIGLTKAPYLEMEIQRHSIELMARLKKAFDPEGILNPGKIFYQST